MSDERERITKLEEGLAFAERTSEQLSEELMRAFEEIRRLTGRLQRLEGRIGDVEQEQAQRESGEDDAPDPALERPPHAAGPRE